MAKNTTPKKKTRRENKRAADRESVPTPIARKRRHRLLVRANKVLKDLIPLASSTRVLAVEVFAIAAIIGWTTRPATPRDSNAAATQPHVIVSNQEPLGPPLK